MELVKLKDKTNGAVIEVKKSLASDYIGTGKYIPVLDKNVVKEPEEKNEKTEKFGKRLGIGKNM